jgi:hypothetical protein
VAFLLRLESLVSGSLASLRLTEYLSRSGLVQPEPVQVQVRELAQEPVQELAQELGSSVECWSVATLG